MSELDIIQDKVNIFATLMRGEFESKIDPLLNSNPSFEELDKLITPKIKLYFQEFGAIINYYNEAVTRIDPDLSDEERDVIVGDPPEGLSDDDYRVQKCLMLKSLFGNRVLTKLHEIMEKAQSIEEIDRELTEKLEWYYSIVDALYAFYHYGKYDEQNQDDD